MFLDLTRARNQILFQPGVMSMDSDFHRQSLGFGAQFAIAMLLLAGSFGLVAAFGLAVTKGFIQVFS